MLVLLGIFAFVILPLTLVGAVMGKTLTFYSYG